jgi:hypothetical protein
MIPIPHRIMAIRDHLDRIERADLAGKLDEDATNLVSGLLGSFQQRLDNVREFVPDVTKADA